MRRFIARYWFLVASWWLLSSMAANASTPVQIPDGQLIKNTDHLLVAHVVDVDMVDEKGREITDLKAKAGPSLTNIIRLIIEVDEVLLTNAPVVPKRLKIPLDPFMQYNLGQIKAAHAGKQPPILLMLKGANFLPPFPGVFTRSLDEKEKFLRALKDNIAK